MGEDGRAGFQDAVGEEDVAGRILFWALRRRAGRVTRRCRVSFASRAPGLLA